jgi:protein KRI1
VPKTSYLSPQEILLLDDKELNQIMSLKKLAPYRDDTSKVRPNYKALQAAKGSLPSQPMWKKHKALQQQQQRMRPAWRVERDEDGSQPQNGRVQGDNGQQQQQQGGEDGGQQQQRQQQQRPHGWKQHSGKHHHHHQQQRSHGGHSGKHGSHPSKHHKQQQQRLDPASKQQARLESYAKLSLKRDRPSGDQQQQQQHAGSWQQRPQKKQKKDAPPPPEGRLAKVAVDVSGLTPAQKKNLKRALKRKEAKGQA